MGARASRKLWDRVLTRMLAADMLPRHSVDADRLAARRDRRTPAASRLDPFTWRSTEVEGPVSGPLAGWTLAVKDSIAVRGAPRSDGTCTVAVRAAADDAEVVATCRAAGAHIVGVTTMTELGVSGLGANAHQGTLDNPAARGYLPGGSSTGVAVAVASRGARAGLGSDALGSVRLPAAFTGLVGLKPTHGALSQVGYNTVAASLDTVGPMARTVGDCARLWQVLSGQRPRKLTPRIGVQVGLINELRDVPVFGPQRVALHLALDSLRATRVPVSLPQARFATTIAGITGAYELANAKGAVAVAPTPEVALAQAFGRAIRPATYEQVQARRASMRSEALEALRHCDVIAMPTSAVPAPARTRRAMEGWPELSLQLAVGAFTPIANCTGLPALAVPAGQAPCGRPLSVMLMGRPGGEDELFAIAASLGG